MMDFSSSVQITKTTKHEIISKERNFYFVRNPKCWTVLIFFFFHLSILNCELNHAYLSIVLSTTNCIHIRNLTTCIKQQNLLFSPFKIQHNPMMIIVYFSLIFLCFLSLATLLLSIFYILLAEITHDKLCKS